MSSYERLAESYDIFTNDVNYSLWADYYESLFEKYNIKPELVLDLACGTGSLSIELAKRGYDMTSVDASEEMLSCAIEKSYELSEGRPLFLCQRMEELDLYGTVDVAICALDSLNYLTEKELLFKTFDRLKFFIRPGGIVIFDVNTETKFKNMDGMSYIRDEENHFCAWSAEYDEDSRICSMIMDIFDKKGSLWERSQEEHIERAHSDDEIASAVENAQFKVLDKFDELSFNCANNGSERVFWIAERK